MASGESLWRNRDYVGWLAGETLSTFGTSLSAFAYPLLILFATHSAAQTGVVAAAGNVGSLVTLLVGGALADRYSRRTLLVVAPLVQAAVVGSVGFAVLAGHVVLAHVAAAGFVDGAILGVTRGSLRAAVRRLVPADRYAAASAQLQGRDMVVRVAAPPVAGVLFSVGRAIPFLADAVSYLASIAGVTAIRRPLGPDRSELGGREPILRSAAVGLRFVARQPYLRFTAVWAAVMNMLGSGSMLLVILLVRERGGGPQTIGGVQGLGFAGGIAGALVSGWVLRRLGGRVLVVGLSWGFVLVALGMAVVPWPWGIGALLAVVSLIAVPMNVTIDTYDMQLIPDELLGRVSTTLDLLGSGLRWLAPLAVGFLVEATSAPATALVWAGAFTVVALFVVTNRSLHVLDRPIAEVAAERA